MKKKSPGRGLMFAGIVAAAVIGLTVALAAFGSGDSGFHRYFTGLFAPVERVVTNWRTSAEEKDRALNEYNALLEENRSLKAQLQELEAQNAEAKTLQEENQRLRALLNMQETNQTLTLVSGNLLVWNDAAWSSAFTVDVGSDDGVAEGNAVLSEDGLVGFVTAVSRRSATVSTVADTGVSFKVCTVTSGITAVAGGEFSLMRSGKICVKDIPLEASPVTGESVRTVETDTVPGDLYVGTVCEIASESGGLSRYATVLPSSDLDSLVQVFIVTDFTGTADGEDQP